LGLDFLKPIQEDERLEIGFDNDDCIQERILCRATDRDRLIQTGCGADPTELAKTL
jgi:hypothetical protein